MKVVPMRLDRPQSVLRRSQSSRIEPDKSAFLRFALRKEHHVKNLDVLNGSRLVKRGARTIGRCFRERVPSWGISETNRRVRFYRLTRDGMKQLETELSDYNRQTKAIQAVLRTA